MDLIGIYKTFHPNTAEHTFIFPTADHGTFSQIEHPLMRKASLSKNIGNWSNSWSSITSERSKTTSQQQEKLQNTHKLMEVRHTLRNNEQALAETQKEIKAFLNWMKRTELAKAGGIQWQPAYRKFIGLKSHSKKPERAQIKDASSALKKNNPDTSQPK